MGSIPGLGRFPGVGNGNPLHYEDPLEQEMAAHSSILAWRIPTDRGAWKATVHVLTDSDTSE